MSPPGRIVVHAGHTAVPEGVRRDVAVLLEDGVVRAIDRPGALAEASADVRLGDGRCLALPGLVNAHQHGRGSGAPARGVPDAPLERWLVALLTGPPVDPYADALAFCRRAVAAGVTVAAHSHTTAEATTEGYDAELRAILRAYRDAGVRGVVAADTRDRGVPVYGDADAFWAALPGPLRDERARLAGPSPPPLDERLEVIAGLRAEARAGRLGDVDVVLGPPGPPWCSDAGLRAVARAAAAGDVPVQTHLHETRAEAGFGRWAYGDGTVAALARLGLLTARLSVAHGVHLDAADRARIAAAGTTVVTNPGSNLRLHAGVAPIPALLADGVPVALGTDNMALDDDEELLGELRLLRALHRRPGVGEHGLEPRALLDIATANGARALGQDDAGALRVGARADVVLVDVGQDLRTDPLELALATARPAGLVAVVAGGRLVAERGTARVAAPADGTPRAGAADPELARAVAALAEHVVPHYRALEDALP